MTVLFRNLPLLLAATGVALSLYMLWKHILRVEHRLTLVSMQLGSNSGGRAYHLGRQDAPPSVPTQFPARNECFDPPTMIVEEGCAPRFVDGSETVFPIASTDVYVGEPEVEERHAEITNITNDAVPDDDSGNVVNAYIQNLQDKFGSSHGLDGGDSVTSETIHDLGSNSRRYPPRHPSRLDVGHQELHNGKMWEVILTKSNAKRWGKPKVKPEESIHAENEPSTSHQKSDINADSETAD